MSERGNVPRHVELGTATDLPLRKTAHVFNTNFTRALLLLTSAVLIACSNEEVGNEGSALSEGAAGSGGSPQVRVIKHPGAGLTLTDLQTLKANVDQGKEPWKSGFNQLANRPNARLSYAGRGGPFAKVSRAPDENLNAWRSDMAAISDQSLMWYFTQDERYAKTAKWLLLRWATTHVEFSGRESMLDLGDYAAAFVGGVSTDAPGTRLVQEDPTSVRLTGTAPTGVWFASVAVQDAVWGHAEGGKSLAVTPSAWARAWSQAASVGLWSQLVVREPDADTPSMRAQLECHQLGAPNKDTWNLEPWRPDVSAVDMIAAACNPE
jgi:hypothetical protein